MNIDLCVLDISWSWGKSQCIEEDTPVDVLLDSACWCFIEKFHIHIFQRYWLNFLPPLLSFVLYVYGLSIGTILILLSDDDENDFYYYYIINTKDTFF